MSAPVLQTTIDFVRGKFTRAEVKDVRLYGGEFSATEIPVTSYTCPAIFITCLGWSPNAASERAGRRAAGKSVRSLSMAAFVATKHVERERRMLAAMLTAEKLALALASWAPEASPDSPYELLPLAADPEGENLYGRAVDAKGQALWLVRWDQDVVLRAEPAQLFDLLSIHIDENYLPGQVPADAAPVAGHEITQVTDSITFPPLPFPPQEP